MTEQRSQLHLRVMPELVELIDAYRGPATRNAYAAMVLEYELKRRHNDAHERLSALADHAMTRPELPEGMAELELASGVPLESLAAAVQSGQTACPHPRARVIKGLCRACGEAVS